MLNFVILPLLLCLFFISSAWGSLPAKLLICGVGKNIEPYLDNLITSSTTLGSHFSDYRIFIYENNSEDDSKAKLHLWQESDPHVITVCEDLTLNQLIDSFPMKIYNRIEAISRARNKILDLIFQEAYSDYDYVVWADLDFTDPWDVEHIIDTIQYPEQEWDAVLANGAYDLFAFRDEEFPIGFELLGNRYWSVIEQIRSQLSLCPQDPWRKVYSAFGGLGIYKKKSIENCYYSAVVTKDLENYVASWLKKPSLSHQTCLLDHYLYLLSTAPLATLQDELFLNRDQFPIEMGLHLNNQHGNNLITWFSCVPGSTFPFTCEHINFHAAMAARRHDKIFVNPKLYSHHP